MSSNTRDSFCSMVFFFFQAEDGIRDLTVTGVQTCALPIYGAPGLEIGVDTSDPLSPSATEFVPTFVVRVFAVSGGSAQSSGRMLLIVRRPYAHLEDRLRRAFGGRDDVAVITDRRRGQRRVSDRLVTMARRRGDRRRRQERLLEGVIEGDPLTFFRQAT